MVSEAIMESLLGRLDRLAPELQQKVVDFADALAKAQPLRGTPASELRPMLGRIDEESARQMLEVIEDGCERVDEGGR